MISDLFFLRGSFHLSFRNIRFIRLIDVFMLGILKHPGKRLISFLFPELFFSFSFYFTEIEFAVQTVHFRFGEFIAVGEGSESFGQRTHVHFLIKLLFGFDLFLEVFRFVIEFTETAGVSVFGIQDLGKEMVDLFAVARKLRFFFLFLLFGSGSDDPVFFAVARLFQEFKQMVLHLPVFSFIAEIHIEKIIKLVH